MSEFEIMAQKNQITLRCEREMFRNLPKVKGDPLRLHEVFSNLISNAIKFNKPGGRVECKVKVRRTFLEIAVRDTGIGIKKEDLPKIFSKFFRVREDIEGTGLGLWISKEIMRRLGGDVTVESKEGEGSTFTVRVLLADKEA